MVSREKCWHCAPAVESHRYDPRRICARCAADTEERPVRYSPRFVRWVLSRMLDWEEAGTPRIVAEDVKMAIAGLARAGRLRNLEQNVLRDRLYYGYSEQRVAILNDRDVRTIRRNAKSACRKIATWLNSTPPGRRLQIDSYRRLLEGIFARGT